MFFINFLIRLIEVLRSAASTRQIAAAFVIGMFGGLNTSFAVTLVAFLCMIVFNVNLTAGLFSLALFGALAHLFDPLLHALGYEILAFAPLLPVWTALYNAPFLPLTQFNNTVVMGSIALSVALAFPLYVGVKKGLVVYREKYDERVRNSRLVRSVRATRFYNWFVTIQRLGAVRW